MTENFQNISFTLPKQRIKEHIFYSTAKNWNRQKDFLPSFQQSKSSALREMSCTTEFTRPKPTFQNDMNQKKLEQKLNEKNELLIKQSKWKNYYLKQEICVLLQQILQHLDSILQNAKQNKEVKAYRKKLQKVINKVQSKRNSQANWLEFFGFQPKNQPSKISDSAPSKIQNQEQKISEIKDPEDNLQSQILKLREQNKRLIQSLNILTSQIESKQKQVISIKEKYSKVKNKKQTLKMELTQLHKQYEILLNENPNIKDKNSLQNDPFPRSNQRNKHLHTYSLDRDFHSRNSNLLVPSQKRFHMGQDSQNLFTLSDTPFIGDKKKDIPVSLQYLEVRKKLLSSQRSVSQKQTRKSLKNKKSISNNSYFRTQDQREKARNKKLCFQEGKQKIINENSYEPSCSFNYQKDFQQQNSYMYVVLSQSLAIQKLLERI